MITSPTGKKRRSSSTPTSAGRRTPSTGTKRSRGKSFLALRDGRLKEISPWLPLRMTHVAGAPYGVGYVESAAIADLQTVEALCQAIAEGSLASSTGAVLGQAKRRD